jgi:hypothetical protein
MGLISDTVRFRCSGLANRERVVGITFALENVYAN